MTQLIRPIVPATPLQVRKVAERSLRAISAYEALATDCGLWFRGDGSPSWHEGRTKKAAQPAREARRLRGNLINLLRRWQDETGELRELAQRLDDCSPSAPCRSGACPVCWRALRRLLVHAAQPLFGVPDRFAFATCIGDDDRILCRELLEVEAITDAERRIMEIAVSTRMRIFGAIDVSANEHRHDRFPPHYQAHPHIFPLANSFDRHRKEFDVYYRSSPMIHHPIKAPTYDGDIRCIAYALDAPRRRISSDPHARRDGSWRADTNDRPLNCQQRVAMARLLDRAGIEARILLYGYELRTDGEDVWLATVSRLRADEMLAVRRREAAQRLRELTNSDRERTRQMRDRERFQPRLWPNRSRPSL